jgi:hypothetical protein
MAQMAGEGEAAAGLNGILVFRRTKSRPEVAELPTASTSSTTAR